MGTSNPLPGLILEGGWERVEKYGQWEHCLYGKKWLASPFVGNGWRSMVNGNGRKIMETTISKEVLGTGGEVWSMGTRSAIISTTAAQLSVGNGWRSMVNGN